MQYRFTQMAANVMHYSKEVAAELNHSYIGTEHILIGLLREKEGLACQVLEDHDVTEEKVLHMVSQLIQGSQTLSRQLKQILPLRITLLILMQISKLLLKTLMTHSLLLSVLLKNH